MRIDSGQWLCIDGIEVSCIIGVTERERASKQRLIINLGLAVDFAAVESSDQIADTVDYRLVSRRVVAEIEKKIERVATEVWKPGALSGAKNVGAVIVSSLGSA